MDFQCLFGLAGVDTCAENSERANRSAIAPIYQTPGYWTVTVNPLGGFGADVDPPAALNPTALNAIPFAELALIHVRLGLDGVASSKTTVAAWLRKK